MLHQNTPDFKEPHKLVAQQYLQEGKDYLTYHALPPNTMGFYSLPTFLPRTTTPTPALLNGGKDKEEKEQIWLLD